MSLLLDERERVRGSSTFVLVKGYKFGRETCLPDRPDKWL